MKTIIQEEIAVDQYYIEKVISYYEGMPECNGMIRGLPNDWEDGYYEGWMLTKRKIVSEIVKMSDIGKQFLLNNYDYINKFDWSEE